MEEENDSWDRMGLNDCDSQCSLHQTWPMLLIGIPFIVLEKVHNFLLPITFANSVDPDQARHFGSTLFDNSNWCVLFLFCFTGLDKTNILRVKL